MQSGPHAGHRRIMIAAFGDPGHAFPAIALGRTLAARGHEVLLETWARWHDHVEREGMRFAAAPEYQVFPSGKSEVKPYQAAVWACRRTRAVIEDFDPDAVVVDILTIAAALAAELCGKPWATLVPHVLPTPAAGLPPFSIGARPPRTRAGGLLWRSLDPLVQGGVELGRRQLNEARRRVALPPLAHVHGGISHALALVATFPQLEPVRAAAEPWVRVTGPLLWEQPYREIEPPAGDDPLVLVAPSTSQDPEQRMLRAALEGLAGEPVRVLATTNRRPPPAPVEVPANARMVDWLSYAQVMPLCDAVICHAGHGTVARALSAGVPVVACPAAGDMAENAARIAWAGAGVALPRRLTSARGVRLALRQVLGDRRYRTRAAELGEWATHHDGARTAADVVEAFADPAPRAGPGMAGG